MASGSATSSRRALHPEAMTDPDLAVLITVVRATGVALHGRPPAELLDPVPATDLRLAIVEGVPGLLADLESDTANVLLTLARIWLTLATGEIRSKDAAADWALARLPSTHRLALARARAIYLGQLADTWGDMLPAARAHADHVVGEIDRTVRGAA